MNLYGLMIGVGIVVGAWIAEKVTRKREIWDVLTWVIIPGVIGARVYHVLDYWEVYAREPWLIPQVWTGGLGIYGAILGGVVGLWLFCKKRKQKFLEWLDVVALGLPVGQAIGRWGNYFNQELYGKPTNLPWRIYIDPEHRLAGYELVDYYHPVFLYESLWSLVIFLVLLGLLRTKNTRLKTGTFFTLYIIFYSTGRFFLEYIRIEGWTGVAPISVGAVTLTLGQLVSLFIVVISLHFMSLRAIAKQSRMGLPRRSDKYRDSSQ